ncbi:hypothetical protein [Zunongwangia sp.]|uniref:hypothetical protein n=1 Tax=Zunongwangia sp. TaxID=1965325 RepID=UPI003AA8E113
MKKTIIILILIGFSTYSCSNSSSLSKRKNDISDYGLNGKVKSLKSEVFSLIQQKDTFRIGNKENSSGLDRNITIEFNQDGKLDFEKEYYANGKLINEVLYTYDKDNKLINRKEIDNYGKGSFYDNEFLYNSKDSITKWIMSNNDFKRIHKIKRDDKNRPVKMEIFQNDTIVYVYKIEYDKYDNIISEKEFKSKDIPIKIIDRTFNEYHLKSKEKVVEYNTWDTLVYESHFFYNSDRNLTLEKHNIENDSSLTEIKNSYYENGKLKESVSKPIGSSYFVITVEKFNKKGDLIEHSRIPSDESPKEIWEYKYKYDYKDNWIEKINFKDNKPLRIIKRSIQYYE